VDYGVEMEAVSASTTGTGAAVGVPSAVESASSGLVKPAAASEQHDENADNLVVLVAAALPMVDGLAMDAIDRSTVDTSTCTEAEKSQEEASSGQVHDESNDGVAVADTDARHGHAAEDVVDGETAENDTIHEDNDEDEEGNHDYDGMEELTEEEEKSAMLNIVLSELLRKFREENGRGPNSEEVLEIRASIAEQLEMEVATSESIEHHNATAAAAAAAAAAATSNQPADPQQQQERDDRKRPAETNCSEKDDDDNNSSSNQPAPKRVKFHSSVASPSQPEDSIAPEPLPNELPETPP
jgi:hypothetical protein